jgi:WD40 repeat protein
MNDSRILYGVPTMKARLKRIGVLAVLTLVPAMLSAQEPTLKTVLEGHKYLVSSVAFSPDGKTLASASDRMICLWDVAAARLEKTLNDNDCIFMNHVAFSPSGEFLAIGGGENKIKLLELKSGADRVLLREKKDSVHPQVVFSQDGKQLAWGGVGLMDIKLWTVGKGQAIDSLKDKEERGLLSSAFAFSADGKTLTAIDRLGWMRTWDTTTRKLLESRELAATADVTAFRPDGKVVAICTAVSAPEEPLGLIEVVQIHDVASGKKLASSDESCNQISAMTYSPDGKTLVTGDGRSAIIYRDAETAKPKTKVAARCQGVFTLAFSPDGGTLASGGEDRKVKIWDSPATRTKETKQP